MPRTRTTALAVALLLAPAVLAGQPAEVPRAPAGPPIWVSAGVGYFSLAGFDDAGHGGSWQWDDAFQLRATAERSLRRDITLGVAGTFARLPYAISGGTCHGCRGDGTVWQALASIRLGGGGGVGFHSVLEGAVGATGFTSFERGTDVSSMPGNPSPAQSVVPTASITYGAGYTINPGLEVNFVQDLGFVFYDSEAGGTGAPVGGSGNGTPRFGVSRLTLRYIIGGRR